MPDIFTIKELSVTPEFGMALKNFRIEHDITATSIVAKFEKSPNYISKLEKGDIKKIDSAFLVDLCNYITQTDTGIEKFLTKASRNYLEYSTETKLILRNIEDLLIEHPISKSFISEINTYMKEHNIILEQLVEKINANEDLAKTNPNLLNSPTNIILDAGIEYADYIKLDIPITYIKDLFEYKIAKVHYVIAEAILYSIYRLGNETDARSFANSKLHLNNILPFISPAITAPHEDQPVQLFSGLDPEVTSSLQGIATQLKLIANLTKKKTYGIERFQQIESNLKSDLGFSFAYMSVDLGRLLLKSKETKQSFLIELKRLIDKYSEEESGLDIYE